MADVTVSHAENDSFSDEGYSEKDVQASNIEERVIADPFLEAIAYLERKHVKELFQVKLFIS